jgi:hypothetical protein
LCFLESKAAKPLVKSASKASVSFEFDIIVFIIFKIAQFYKIHKMNGLGMVENQPLGFENFVKAAEQGHGFAHHMIAVAYMTGEGVEKDIWRWCKS